MRRHRRGYPALAGRREIKAPYEEGVATCRHDAVEPPMLFELQKLDRGARRPAGAAEAREKNIDELTLLTTASAMVDGGTIDMPRR
jgi:hypothetical protein